MTYTDNIRKFFNGVLSWSQLTDEERALAKKLYAGK